MGNTQQKPSPQVHAEQQVVSGDFSLYGELCQNHSGPYIRLTDVFAGKRGDTIQIPVQSVAEFYGALDAVAAGSELVRVKFGEKKTLHVSARLSPDHGPFFKLDMWLGDREYRAEIPVATLQEVKEKMDELVHASVTLTPLPQARQDRKPQEQRRVSGTGNLARPVRDPRDRDPRDRKPQQQQGGGIDRALVLRLVVAVEALAASNAACLAILSRKGKQVGPNVETLVAAAIEQAKAPAAPPSPELVKKVELKLSEGSLVTNPPEPVPPHDIPAPPVPESVAVSAPQGQTAHATADAPAPPAPPVEVAPPAPPVAEAPVQCTLCGKGFPSTETVKVDGDAVCLGCKHQLDATPVPAEPVAA